MGHLNTDWHTPEAWQVLRRDVLAYGAVPVEEMERVLELATRVVALAPYRGAFPHVLRAVRYWSKMDNPADREAGAE